MNTVTVSFNQDELNALTQLLDVSVKALGVQGARPALALLDKLQAAVNLANNQAANPQPEIIVNN